MHANKIIILAANPQNQKLGLLKWKIRNIRSKTGTKNSFVRSALIIFNQCCLIIFVKIVTISNVNVIFYYINYINVIIVILINITEFC